MKTLMAWSLLAGIALADGESPSKVEGVSQSAVQSAFQILRSEYIRSGDLTFDELNRAAFQGLLERLDLGAELVSKVDAERPLTRHGVLAEMLTEQIAYLRPLGFAEDEPHRMKKLLTQYVAEKIPYLILDLRSAASPGTFETAAAMLDLFIPRGQLMFKLKQVGRDDPQLFIASHEPVWTKPLVVLVDGETCNLGETVAAVLQDRKQALLIGSKTRGATVRYETLPLDDHWKLRFARAEMLLEGDRSLFKKGISPDFPLDLAPAIKRQIFDGAGAVKDALFDHGRQRYNEAALIARKNPEIDSYIRRSSGEVLEDDRPAIRDTVLQRAVDMLNARTHLQETRLKWPAGKSRTGNSSAPTIKKAEPVTPP